MATFFSRLNYSACNEDSNAERHALRLTASDTVLCITGSGARALDLLVDAPRTIISVDVNPTQNYLLELKMAAYRQLDYEEFCILLGLDAPAPHPGRALLYGGLRAGLSEPARAYWDRRQDLIVGGVLYAGTWEKLLRRIAALVSLKKRARERLFAAQTLDEQRDIWEHVWRDRRWKMMLKLISSRLLWKYVIREPGARLIPDEFSIYDYMDERLNLLASRHFLRTNHFVSLLMLGHYHAGCTLPLHLQREQYARLKANIDRIRPVTAELAAAVADPALHGHITAYSLSDFSSYAPLSAYQSIWRLIGRHAAPGARFCERHFLVKRSPDGVHPAIQRDAILEGELERMDSAFIYTFCAGDLGRVNNYEN